MKQSIVAFAVAMTDFRKIATGILEAYSRLLWSRDATFGTLLVQCLEYLAGSFSK